MVHAPSMHPDNPRVRDLALESELARLAADAVRLTHELVRRYPRRAGGVSHPAVEAARLAHASLHLARRLTRAAAARPIRFATLRTEVPAEQLGLFLGYRRQEVAEIRRSRRKSA